MILMYAVPFSICVVGNRKSYIGLFSQWWEKWSSTSQALLTHIRLVRTCGYSICLMQIREFDTGAQCLDSCTWINLQKTAFYKHLLWVRKDMCPSMWVQVKCLKGTLSNSHCPRGLWSKWDKVRAKSTRLGGLIPTRNPPWGIAKALT